MYSQRTHEPSGAWAVLLLLLENRLLHAAHIAVARQARKRAGHKRGTALVVDSVEDMLIDRKACAPCLSLLDPLHNTIDTIVLASLLSETSCSLYMQDPMTTAACTEQNKCIQKHRHGAGAEPVTGAVGARAGVP